MRNVAYYWFRNTGGPRKGGLVQKDGALVPLDYANHADIFKVRDTADVVGVVNLSPRDGQWSGESRSPVHHSTLWVSAFDTAEECAAALLDLLAEEAAPCPV